MRHCTAFAAFAVAGSCAIGCGDVDPYYPVAPYDPYPTPPVETVDAGTPPQEPPVLADPPPPSISGGTLLVTSDGLLAVAADPDRDRVWIVDLQALTSLGSVALEPGDEPGRTVEGAAGRVHVALRSAGAVATIDLATRSVIARTPVCAEPRGLAYDVASARLHVACAGGELSTLDAASGLEVRKLRIDRDLRDVVIDGAELWVTRFRSAELLHLDPTGAVIARLVLPGLSQLEPRAPAVAWRAVPTADGRMVIVHQQAVDSPVFIQPAGYGQSSCGSIVTSAVAVVDPQAPVVGMTGPVVAMSGLPALVLPVDVALSPDGTTAAFVGAGSHTVVRAQMVSLGSVDGCGASPTEDVTTVPSEPVAVAFTPDGTLVLQSREPASVWVFGKQEIPLLDATSRRDTGHELFHQAAPSGLACASCHPEGTDDAHVWDFETIGERRTQNLRGEVLQTAPFHWNGDLPNMEALVSEVLTGRMAGMPQSPERVAALARWIDALPSFASAAPEDPAAVARGAAIFADAKTGCATCHAGPRFTSNDSTDVGTGQAFQIPSLLGLAWRAPYLHDGCAPTIRDRFGPCGGGAHGVTSHLISADLDDLVAYLETL